MEIGEEIDSDHHPLVVSLRGGRGRKWGKGGRGEGQVGKYGMREVGRLEWREGDGNEKMKEMGERIREILGSIEKERGKERKGKEKKVEMRRVLREWRKDKGGGEEYRKQKREYKELCGNKKEEENERWGRKVEGARNEGQVWEIVNRERKKWKGINKEIEMRKWEEYFKELLGRVEGRVVRGEEERRSEGQKWI
ncbi:hypothetical protein ALC57_04363 [Trachymyrmex cornetzi]|uniref:Uncharacterized protein n=1 Tax=Trachymyrmex cornetzi TaxID=471704 RepID=A0A151JCA7_9HYME|nr:hypothetical protein ALC57_04363 [Trachymyrmex cornetzi]